MWLLFFALRRLSERKDGKLGQFEVLHAKRNANDGDAEHGANNEVGNGQFDATKDNPKDVEYKTEASHRDGVEGGRLAKGVHSIEAYFH